MSGCLVLSYWPGLNHNSSGTSSSASVTNPDLVHPSQLGMSPDAGTSMEAVWQVTVLPCRSVRVRRRPCSLLRVLKQALLREGSSITEPDGFSPASKPCASRQALTQRVASQSARLSC